MSEHDLTPSDFHNVLHKHLVNTVADVLGDAKLDWELVEPFLESARDLCRGDFRNGGAQIQIHTVTADGDQWVPAEEAFLGISVSDQERGEEWLSETYWISDIVIADGDPERVRNAIAALERSIAKMRGWLGANEEIA